MEDLEFRIELTEDKFHYYICKVSDTGYSIYKYSKDNNRYWGTSNLVELINYRNRKEFLDKFFVHVPKERRRTLIEKMQESVNWSITSSIDTMTKILEYKIRRILKNMPNFIILWKNYHGSEDGLPKKRIIQGNKEKEVIDYDKIELEDVSDLVYEKMFPEEVEWIFREYFAYKRLETIVDDFESHVEELSDKMLR